MSLRKGEHFTFWIKNGVHKDKACHNLKTTKYKACLLIADSLSPCDLDGGGGDGRSCDLRKKIHHHSSSSCSPTSRSTPSSEALDQVGDLRAAPAHPTGGMGGHTTLPTRSANIRPNGNSINFNGNNTEDLYAKVKSPLHSQIYFHYKLFDTSTGFFWTISWWR